MESVVQDSTLAPWASANGLTIPMSANIWLEEFKAEGHIQSQMCCESSLSSRATIAVKVSLPSCRTASTPHYSHNASVSAHSSLNCWSADRKSIRSARITLNRSILINNNTEWNWTNEKYWLRAACHRLYAPRLYVKAMHCCLRMQLWWME